MTLAILLLGSLGVLFRFPRCRQLLLGEWQPSPTEQRICLSFSHFSLVAALLLLLLTPARLLLGNHANLLGLAVLLGMMFRFVYTLWHRF